MNSIVKIEDTPIGKLIDVINGAIGVVNLSFQQNHIVETANPSEQVLAIQSGKAESLLAGNTERYNLISAIERRIIAREEKRQNNIEKVVSVAAKTIKDETNVSSEPVNPDWATRFFDISQDISDEAMQDLWGRILAGEVKQPHSYSLRTLDALRNITSEEAQLFEKVARYILDDGSYYIYRDSFENCPDVDFKYADIARLMEMGLIQAGSMVVQNYYNTSNKNAEHHLYYGDGYVAFVKMPADLLKMSFPIYPLTHVGEELMKLISIEPNRAYFEFVLQKILEENKHLSKDIHIKYAKIIKHDPIKGEIEYDDDTIKEIVVLSKEDK